MEPGGGGSPDRPDCTMRVVRVSGRRGKQDSTHPFCLVPGCPGSRQGAVPVSTCLLCGGPWGHCREMERETEEGTGEEEANVGCFAKSLPLWATGVILLAISGRQGGAHAAGVPLEGRGSWGVRPPTPTSPRSPRICAEVVPFSTATRGGVNQVVSMRGRVGGRKLCSPSPGPLLKVRSPGKAVLGYAAASGRGWPHSAHSRGSHRLHPRGPVPSRWHCVPSSFPAVCL